MVSFTCSTCAKNLGNCDSISCDKCNSWHHLSCSNTDKPTFDHYCNDKTQTWLCPDCTYLCSSCNLLFKKNSNSICCANWETWLHLKFSGLTKINFLDISQTDKQWYCRNCLHTIFPFNSIDNNKLRNTMHPKTETKLTNQGILNANTYCTRCSTYHNLTRVPTVIHVITLYTKNVAHLREESWFQIGNAAHVWKKIPFHDVNNEVLIAENFDSNYVPLQF